MITKRASFAIAFVAATASLGTRFTLADEKLDIVAIVTKADAEKIVGVPVKPPQGGNKQGADGYYDSEWSYDAVKGDKALVFDYLVGKPGLDDWTSVIGAYLVGQAAEEKLFAAAESTDKEKDRGQHCQAWFYAGMKKLLEGDKKTATDYFQKCLATDETVSPEFASAAAELRNLNHE